MMDQAIYTRNLKPISIRRTTFLVHRKCTRKAKIYPKLQKSTKSKTEGMSRPLKAVLHSNKERRKMRFNSMIERSSPLKILMFRSRHMFHIINCRITPQTDAFLCRPTPLSQQESNSTITMSKKYQTSNKKKFIAIHHRV